ncbi:hypothetical protein ABPG75_001436 [Micractinium tetrahymenae]
MRAAACSCLLALLLASGVFGKLPTTPSCTPLNDGCRTCQGTQCTSCLLGYTLRKGPKPCTPGPACQAGKNGCKTCQVDGAVSYCIECKDASYFLSPDDRGGICMKKRSNYPCTPGSTSGCLACDAKRAKCIQCDTANQWLLDSAKGTCFKCGQPGTPFNKYCECSSATNKCQRCTDKSKKVALFVTPTGGCDKCKTSPLCATCSGTKGDKCASCTAGYALKGKSCVQCKVKNCDRCDTDFNVCAFDGCKPGFSPASKGRQCVTCEKPRCARCRNKGACTLCQPGFLLRQTS